MKKILLLPVMALCVSVLILVTFLAADRALTSQPAVPAVEPVNSQTTPAVKPAKKTALPAQYAYFELQKSEGKINQKEEFEVTVYLTVTASEISMANVVLYWENDKMDFVKAEAIDLVGDEQNMVMPVTSEGKVSLSLFVPNDGQSAKMQVPIKTSTPIFRVTFKTKVDYPGIFLGILDDPGQTAVYFGHSSENMIDQGIAQNTALNIGLAPEDFIDEPASL